MKVYLTLDIYEWNEMKLEVDLPALPRKGDEIWFSHKQIETFTKKYLEIKKHYKNYTKEEKIERVKSINEWYKKLNGKSDDLPLWYNEETNEIELDDFEYYFMRVDRVMFNFIKNNEYEIIVFIKAELP